MSTRGYALEPRFESSATFMRYEGPNFAVAVILAFLLVQPLIIYLIVAGRGVRTMVTRLWRRRAAVGSCSVETISRDATTSDDGSRDFRPFRGCD